MSPAHNKKHEKDSDKYCGNLLLRLARRIDTNQEDAYLIGEALKRLPKTSCKIAVEALFKAGSKATDAYPAFDIAVANQLKKSIDPELVLELYNRIPKESLALQKTGIEVCRQCAQIMRDQNTIAQHPTGYIEVLNNYTGRLLLAWQIKEANTNVDITFEFVSKHYEEDPQRFYAHYIETLQNRAVIYSYLSKKELAIRDYEHAINVIRNHKEYPRRGLARILNNYAGMLFATEQWDKALKNGSEAVAHYQDIYEESGKVIETQFSSGLESWVEDCRPELADALIALSTYQNKAGKHEEALDSVTQAKKIFSDLNDYFPDQFSRHLAMVHNNYAMCYSELKCPIKVREHLEKSLTIYKKLATNHLLTIVGEYFHVFINLIRSKILDHDYEEALIDYDELVKIYSQLPQDALPSIERYIQSILSLKNTLQIHYTNNGQLT